MFKVKVLLPSPLLAITISSSNFTSRVYATFFPTLFTFTIKDSSVSLIASLTPKISTPISFLIGSMPRVLTVALSEDASNIISPKSFPALLLPSVITKTFSSLSILFKIPSPIADLSPLVICLTDTEILPFSLLTRSFSIPYSNKLSDVELSTRIVILGFPFTVFVSNKNGLAIATRTNAKIDALIIKKTSLCPFFSLS